MKSHVSACFFSIILCLCCLFFALPVPVSAACHEPCLYSSHLLPFILLSDYTKTIPIDGEFQLIAVTSSGDLATFKSSNSAIASVNTYGVVTGKKSGTVKITARIKDAEASCKVTVSKSTIQLDPSVISMENGSSVTLKATVSTNHPAVFKSSSASIAFVDPDGVITARKPGTATITATADGVRAKCKVIVKKPRLSLNETSVTLYRTQTFQLKLTCSSSRSPLYKSSKSSVAVVDENGLILAQKNGTARITARLDGVSVVCKVTVEKPVIVLSETHLSLKPGDSCQLNASVSSGNTPEWSTSNSNLLTVSSNGLITARQAGKAYVYVREDGVKESCIVTITDPASRSKSKSTP